MALTGPVGSAGAQFVLSLVLLAMLDPQAFGRFSFLLLTAQLSWGVWSALFCVPLPVLMANADPQTRDRQLRTLFTADLLGALGAFLLFTGLSHLLGLGWMEAVAFAGFAAVALIRWFARALAYAAGRPFAVTLSDLVYTAVLLVGALLMWATRDPTPIQAYGAMLAGVLAGLIPFGPRMLATLLGSIQPRRLRGYATIWRDQSRWALTGVITTEATANAHAYLVTLLLGPTVFALLAASALMVRPINVAINALTEFERARMARFLAAGQDARVASAIRASRAMLFLIWLATGALTAAVFWYDPRLVFAPEYDATALATGAALWMACAVARLVRTPDSAVLQAGGMFRRLAMTSLWSCGFSIGAVLILLLAGGPLWSIVGVLLGETVFTWFVWRERRRFFAARGESVQPPASAPPQPLPLPVVGPGAHLR